jgi:hypothetical protein
VPKISSYASTVLITYSRAEPLLDDDTAREVTTPAFGANAVADVAIKAVMANVNFMVRY